MSFWNNVKQGNINRMRQDAAGYAEGMARAAGVGAPGAGAAEAMAVGQDLKNGMKALVGWVSSWF